MKKYSKCSGILCIRKKCFRLISGRACCDGINIGNEKIQCMYLSIQKNKSQLFKD